jgi:hypothetical protein
LNGYGLGLNAGGGRKRGRKRKSKGSGPQKENKKESEKKEWETKIREGCKKEGMNGRMEEEVWAMFDIAALSIRFCWSE